MNGNESTKAALLTGLARQAIEAELGQLAEPEPTGPETRSEWLGAPAATFVTLTLDGRLRGCIGSLEARRSLREDLADNARAAAFGDPRFPALTSEELEDLEVEVSVLSAPEPIECRSEAELLEILRPGIDGVVLECGARRSTFLPQVWESLPDPVNFLGALKKKAGLALKYWDDEIRFSRYSVEKFSEVS